MMSSQYRILVVDDTEANRDLVQRRLQKAGYLADGVDSGLAALDVVRVAPFDAVLLDVMMPGLDGIETLRRLRQTHSQADLPVIMVTAKGESDTVVEALQAGANDFVSKPIDFAILMARLSNQLARKTAETELKMINSELEGRVRTRTEALRLANEGLAHSESRLRAVLDQAGDAVICFDSQDVIRVFNAAATQVFGYGEDEAIGRNVTVLLPEEDVASLRDAIRNTEAQSSARTALNLNAQRRNKEIFPAEMSISMVREDVGQLFILVLRDITERHQMEARLRQAEKMEAVGRLTGGVAHDFNNLLTVIMGNLQLLERQLASSDTAMLRLAKVLGAARSGAELTRRLLTFSRQQVLETISVDLNELVANMEQLLARTLGEEIQLVTQLSQTPCWAMTDRNQLENALLNLCINARDAMPDGGRLTIETRYAHLTAEYADRRSEVKPGDYIEIAVSDTGTGIPPALLTRIFEPFFTTKGDGKGTGLGLASIFGFMKQSDGHVSVYSEVGHGTTFRLYVPVAPNMNPDMAPATRLVSNHIHRGFKILLVEDNENVREIAAALLEDAGFSIIEAEDGPSGLEAFQRHPDIHMVFTDVIMPGGMTGPQMVEHIRERRPNIPVLFASGYAEQALRDREDLLRSAGFVAKPYDVNELPRLIESLLAEAGL